MYGLNFMRRKVKQNNNNNKKEHDHFDKMSIFCCLRWPKYADI